MKNHIHRAKFSLIELLVVIAIIAVLASMLLPALNNARASAKKTNCVNQIKQLSSACFLYAGDNYDYFPHDGNPNEWKYVLGSSYYYKCYSHGEEENPHHNKQWHCTDYNEEVAQTNNAGDCSVPTLQITANVAGSSKIWGTNNTKEAVGVKLTFFRRPSITAAVLEKEWQAKSLHGNCTNNLDRSIAYGGCTPFYYYGPHRHQGVALIGYLDGHVKAETKNLVDGNVRMELFSGDTTSNRRWF